MLKLRLMGTHEDLNAFQEFLEQKQSDFTVLDISDRYPNKGTDRFCRMYVELTCEPKTEKKGGENGDGQNRKDHWL